MKTAIVACLVALLTPSLASASDTKWLVFAAAGHATDYASSVWFSTNGGICLEGNSLAGHSDGTFDARKGAIGMGVAIAAEWAVLKFTGKSKSDSVRTAGTGLVIGAGAFSYGLAAMNVAGQRCKARR